MFTLRKATRTILPWLSKTIATHARTTKPVSQAVVASGLILGSALAASQWERPASCTSYSPGDAIGEGIKGEFWKASHSNVTVMEIDEGAGPAVIFLLTKLRNKDTSDSDFVFYASRLIRLILELGLSTLDLEDKEVECCENDTFTGLDFEDTPKFCGVAVGTSGKSMLPAFLDIEREGRTGLIDVKRGGGGGSPQVGCVELPKDVADRVVLVFDPIIATGRFTEQAIAELVSRGVEEQNILVINVVCAPQGVDRLCKRFPGVSLFTAAMDPRLDRKSRVRPGIGDFSKRYLGVHDDEDE